MKLAYFILFPMENTVLPTRNYIIKISLKLFNDFVLDYFDSCQLNPVQD